ncbi:MAG: ribosome recycling factor [Candidatus Peregrinibacteria bacterium]
MPADPRIVSFHQECEKVLQYLRTEYAKLQTGRANPTLVEHISVEAYGQTQPLKTIAGVSVDGRTITIQPWDASITSNVERAIQLAKIGANPVNDGRVIRITLPAMTEDRRKEMTKIVHQLAEEARISVRQQRQLLHDSIKQEKDEDVKELLLKELQKETDDSNAKIVDTAKKKEQEVMTV